MCLNNVNRNHRPSRSLHLAIKVFESGNSSGQLVPYYRNGCFKPGVKVYRDKTKRMLMGYRTGYHAFLADSNKERGYLRFVLLTNITATGDQWDTKAIVGRAMYILTDEEAATVKFGKPIPKALKEKFWALYNESKPKKSAWSFLPRIKR